MVHVPGSSQHHQLVGGFGGEVDWVTFVGEREWVGMSALVRRCIGLMAGKSQVGETSPRICNRGLFVLPDTA